MTTKTKKQPTRKEAAKAVIEARIDSFSWILEKGHAESVRNLLERKAREADSKHGAASKEATTIRAELRLAEMNLRRVESLVESTSSEVREAIRRYHEISEREDGRDSGVSAAYDIAQISFRVRNIVRPIYIRLAAEPRKPGFSCSESVRWLQIHSKKKDRPEVIAKYQEEFTSLLSGDGDTPKPTNEQLAIELVALAVRGEF